MSQSIQAACYNNTLAGLDNKHLFHTFLKAEKIKIKVNLVSGEDLLLWFIDSCPVTAHGQTDKGVLWGLFNKGINLIQGFPHSSVGKESACNAGDTGSMPGLGRSSGEGIGYPLQYSWASLVAQLVKNLPTMRETWVWSLGWEDPHSSILAWKTPWTEEPGGLYSTG